MLLLVVPIFIYFWRKKLDITKMAVPRKQVLRKVVNRDVRTSKSRKSRQILKITNYQAALKL